MSKIKVSVVKRNFALKKKLHLNIQVKKVSENKCILNYMFICLEKSLHKAEKIKCSKIEKIIFNEYLKQMLTLN